METAEIRQLIAKLGENVSGLKEAMEPLIVSDLNETANKLPVLDRAKLFALVAYTIESIIFSNLRLRGVNAKEHPIFAELSRVRQYFDKIKAAEEGGERPSMRVDKAAVGRILRHHLARANNSNGGSSSALQGTKRKFDTQVEQASIPQSQTSTGSQAHADEAVKPKKEKKKKKSKKQDAAGT